MVSVFNSLEWFTGFGGVVVNYDNSTGSNFAAYTLVKGKDGSWDAYDTYYTNTRSGKFSVRGLASEETDFAIYVRDKWDNCSDTLYFTTTPWFESELDKKSFQHVALSDEVMEGYGYTYQHAFNGISGSQWDTFHSGYPIPFPHYFTLDLGTIVQLSRFKMYQRPGSDCTYMHGNPKYYKVYGRTDKPTSAGMEGWTELLTCNSFKPSGLPVGEWSDEDYELGVTNGEEFEFPLDADPVRYVRFEFLQSWSGMECTVMAEVTFWGDTTISE
ncbi:MAG: DUF5126 domain-containing protein [Bacteroidales bacterium]|nr:DUF5126 domain-containing protein [Bacteroidales bacterium]